jgi:hypothetical protein
VHGGNFRISAPSVFRADETEFHKYAAILAATAPYKELCSRQIKKSLNPVRQLIFSVTGMFRFTTSKFLT